MRSAFHLAPLSFSLGWNALRDRTPRSDFTAGVTLARWRARNTCRTPKGAALYRKAGLDSAFVQRILATRNDEIWIPSRAELLQAHALTR
jgi:hypothetical protein